MHFYQGSFSFPTPFFRPFLAKEVNEERNFLSPFSGLSGGGVAGELSACGGTIGVLGVDPPRFPEVPTTTPLLV